MTGLRAGGGQRDRDCVIADLQALNAALDSRLLHLERVGVRGIAHEAGVLKQQALNRLEAPRAKGE